MKTKLNNFEEIECGVSVAGSEKQEWSFTLYDFDGRGKITKDDLAQLLKSLYAAVGSTISLPKSGTKTLKLKLTVSPDTAKANNNNINLSPQHQGKGGKENSSKIVKDTMKQNNLSPLIGAQASKKRTPLDLSSKDCKNHKEEVKNTNVLQDCSPSKLASKPHLSHKDKRHLVQLVQQNMERHQQQQQQRTKHKSHHHRSKHKHKHQTAAPVATGAAPEQQPSSQESQERRNYYLDLAGIENYNVTRLQTENVAGLESIALEGSPSKRRHHRRDRHKNRDKSHRDTIHVDTERTEHSRVADFVIPPYQFLENMVERVTEQTVDGPQGQGGEEGSPSAPLQTPPPPPRMRPVSLPPHLPDVVSPHHHRRHRNRERNRRLAMQQVAEWIEREHPNFGGQLQVLEEINVDCPTTTEGLNLVQNDSQTQQIVIERHEHHHIHEHHHHHHYHYYQET
uniref:Protein naked cuticle homolog n=1 Tax=Platynereis dumerilii TaxID=6359 RepID=A0A1B1M0N9_PLADU|nr:naked cuticle protein [Platynereis dumerilii]